MNTLIEMVRDHRIHPAMSEEKRRAKYGTYTPTRRRASLSASQSQRQGNNRPTPKFVASVAGNCQDDEKDTRLPIRTTDDPDGRQTSKYPIIYRKGNGGNQGYYQPHATRVPWKALLIGIAIPVGLYTILFLFVAEWIVITNTWNYGPTHTAYTHATLNGQSSTIATSNVDGSIYITIINDRDGTAKTYAGPALNSDAWNGDMGGIVATAEVTQNQATPTITIHLIGSVSYFHLFFARPQMIFQLVPDKQAGYKVIA